VTTGFPLRVPLPRVVEGGGIRLEVQDGPGPDVLRPLVDRSRSTLSCFLGWAVTPLSPDEEAAHQADALDQWRRGLMGPWVIYEGGEPRGALGLHRRGGPDELEIGYWLDDLATGRGIMTTACRLATDVAFEAEGVDFVEIHHDKANLRSGAVPARLGYRRCAAYTAVPRARLETGVKVVWRVSRRDWLARGLPTSVQRAE